MCCCCMQILGNKVFNKEQLGRFEVDPEVLSTSCVLFHPLLGYADWCGRGRIRRAIHM